MNQNINIFRKCKKIVHESLEDFEAFVEYSNDMQNVYKKLKSTTLAENLMYY